MLSALLAFVDSILLPRTNSVRLPLPAAIGVYYARP